MHLDGPIQIFEAVLDPDDTVGLLLNVDSLDSSVLRAHRRHLVFDIHEEVGLLSEVDLRWVEHAGEHNAVGGTKGCLVARLSGSSLARLPSAVRTTRLHHWVLVAAKLLHERSAILSRVQVSIGRVFPKLFLFSIGVIAGSICQNVDLEGRPFDQLEPIHRLCCNLCLLVRRELYDCVTTILASEGVLGQLNGVDLTKGGEALADVGLRNVRQVIDKATDIDTIVLLTLSVLIARCKRVAERGHVSLVSSTKEIRREVLYRTRAKGSQLTFCTCSRLQLYFSPPKRH